jgi:hypothetical protein
MRQVIRKKYGDMVITFSGMEIDVPQRIPDEILDVTNSKRPKKITKLIDSGTKNIYTKQNRRP